MVKKILFSFIIIFGGGLLFADAHGAADAIFTANNTWMLVSTLLVFIMHLGFAALESGLTRSKNTVNILFKNISIVAIGILTYFLCGFNLMYPGDFNGYIGFAGFGLSLPDGASGLIEYADGAYTYYTDFIFQAMFAATAATIVSGAVAERIKLSTLVLDDSTSVLLKVPVTARSAKFLAVNTLPTILPVAPVFA